MNKTILILCVFLLYLKAKSQVQVQTNVGLEEFGINTLIQKSITTNNKFNYYNHSSFDVNTKKRHDS